MGSRVTRPMALLVAALLGAAAGAVVFMHLVDLNDATAFFGGVSVTAASASSAAAVVVLIGAVALILICAHSLVRPIRGARVPRDPTVGAVIALIASLVFLAIALLRRQPAASLCCPGSEWQLKEALRLDR